MLVRLNRRPGAALQLVILGHAGSSAALYADVARQLPGFIEPILYEYPGRGRRRREPLMRRIEPIAADLAEALEAEGDAPRAVFGHSMGALVGFAATARLCAAGRPPQLLVVSARVAPPIRTGRAPVGPLTDAQLRDRLEAAHGTPQALLENPAVLAATLPILRADYEACETYAVSEDARVPAPICAYGGAVDSTTPAARLQQWARHTERSFASRLFPGGHFYMGDSTAMFIRALGEDLAALRMAI